MKDEKLNEEFENINEDITSSFAEDGLTVNMSEAVNSQEPLSVQSLIAAGAGFGHKNIHPSMRPFVYSETETGCLINMDKSFTMIKKICEFLEKKVESGYKIVLLGDKNTKEFLQFSHILENYCKTQMISYIPKHRGGVLTNFQVLHASISKYKELLAKKADLDSRIANAESKGLHSMLSGLKKIASENDKQLKNYKGYDGLKHLNSVERCIFITPSIRRSMRFIEQELIPLNQRNANTPEKHSYLIGLADSDAKITNAIKIEGITANTVEEYMAHYSNYNKYVWPVFANDDKFASVFMIILNKFFEHINLARKTYDAIVKKRNEIRKAAEQVKNTTEEKKPSNNYNGQRREYNYNGQRKEYTKNNYSRQK